MTKRKDRPFALPEVTRWAPAPKTPEEEALARYQDRCHYSVSPLVAEAREYELSLEQLLGLVRAEWKEQSEA